MNAQLIILKGGEDVKKRTNESLFKNVTNLSATKKILVIPWTSDSVEKEMEYRTIFSNYFTDSGFSETKFMESEDTKTEIYEKLSSVDVVYLPGGDPEVLYRELKSRLLQDSLRNFMGILIGNSAGAIVLSKGAQHEGRFYPGFGLVDFFITVHFKLEEESHSGSKQNSTINIPEDMWVTISGKS